MNSNSNTNDSPDFLPTASIEALKFRAQMLKQIRTFFDELGFFEVQTPILSHDTVVDRYLEPVSVPKNNILFGSEAGADPDQRLWLQTSPEFAMKRIMAAGAQAIYQICPAIRAGEQGGVHNPEFTMLEWYRAADDLAAGMQLLSDFVEAIFNCAPAVQISYRQLFLDCLKLDPLLASDLEITDRARELKLVEQSERLDRDNALNLLLSQAVEPQLDPRTPTIVFDWPASQSALAIIRDESPAVAERFELYYQGVELANGYHELLDADELLQRNRSINQRREADGAEPLPEKSRLLEAMRNGMPACSGVAIGVDRLVMVGLKASSISEVIPMPIDRA